MGAYVCTQSCALLYIAAVFMKAKDWKRPKCPSVLKERMEEQTLVHPDVEILLLKDKIDGPIKYM